MSVRALGEFERDLRELRQVIVVADRIERPKDTLEEAVEDNLAEGVKYLFLVSNSKADAELTGYYLIFEALARIVAGRHGRKQGLSDLVEIRRLPYDWPDYPHIFYFAGTSDDPSVYAFRGNEAGEGIADWYEALPPRTAASVARALLAGAPMVIGSRAIEVGEFKEPNHLRLVQK